jgi:(1->4)-alpha-D-glucan 1-alpha-D-glucosylmutase
LAATTDALDWPKLTDRWHDGHLKLAWTRQLLKIRADLGNVFTDGDYVPLAVTGRDSDHVMAFARRRGRQAAVVAVVRHFAPLTQVGRSWPALEGLEGAIDVSGLAVDGAADGVLPLNVAFKALPVAIIPAGIAQPRSSRAARLPRDRPS